MDLQDAKRLMPMTAQPILLNPDPASSEFIARQIARVARLRGDGTDDARAEIARCEENLKLSARSFRGRVRIAVERRKF